MAINYTTFSTSDTYRGCRLRSGLIHAQRNRFDAHSHERPNAKRTFHAQWEKE
jgi:6-phosphogluconate dehydrogenase